MILSKKDKEKAMIETAKEQIYASVTTPFVLAELIKVHGISVKLSRRIYNLAKKSISRDILGKRIESLSVKLFELENLQSELRDYTDASHTFIDALGNEQDKDISRYFALRQTNIVEQVKLITQLSDAEDKLKKRNSGASTLKLVVSASRSELSTEIINLIEQDKGTD